MRGAAILLLAGCLAAPAVGAPIDDVAAEILDGVDSIAAPGVPGPLVLTGRRVVPLVTGGPVGEPVAAAGFLGRGRVVALGHNGYLGTGARSTGDTGRFLDQALRWAAGGGKAPVVGVLAADLKGSLLEAGFEVELLGEDWWTHLASVKVLLVDVHRVDDGARKSVREHLHRGGGLVTGGLGWGWLQLHPGSTIHDHPGNLLLGEAGIRWADGTLARTTKTGFATGEEGLAAAHAPTALDVLVAAEKDSGNISPDVVGRASAVVVRAARTLPPDDDVLIPSLRRLAGDARRVLPTPDRPLGPAEPLSRALLAFDLREMEARLPEKVEAHPSSASFPGRPDHDARPSRRKVTLDLARPRWQGTGAWAPAGSVVAVTVPDGSPPGLTLRIGSHTDRLWGLERWKRCPEITLKVPLVRGVNRVASPFGGLLYFEGPGKPGSGVIEVLLEGVLDAPRFVLGRDTVEDWTKHLRDRPAPWAELETGKVILTVPSAEARKVKDPEALLRFWDRVMDGCADLAGIPRERASPERYCADVQISAGYMHSGYPIMVQLDAPSFMLDLEGLSKGRRAWGPFHEMGHNHQVRDWTFAGTVEVTNNLFTLYLLETLCGVKPKEGHKAYPAKPEAVRAYLASGPDFGRWKRDPFLALTMYGQVLDAFGWEPFRKVFAEYAGLAAKERPANDDEKRDQWMVRLSRTLGRNLGPFFETWGVPTSAAARREVESLEAWMPEGFPPR